MNEHKKRVIGLGGIFFKTKNPNEIKSWYQKHPGFNTDEYDTCFEWRQADNIEKKGFSQWSPFSDDTDYFQPSQIDFIFDRNKTTIGRKLSHN